MNKKTSNFLQGTLKQNLDKITESYHQRNGIVTGTGFQTDKVNEGPPKRSGSDPFIDRDGWNKEVLADVGLLDWLEEIEKMAYELKSGRRGSYGISGETGQDLIDDFEQMLEKLERVIQTMEGNIR